MTNILQLVGSDRFVCDFCESTDIYWEYPCERYTIDLGDVIFDNKNIEDPNWVACKKCSELIEAEDWDGLARRTPTKSQKQFESLKQLHASFASHRCGKRFKLIFQGA